MNKEKLLAAGYTEEQAVGILKMHKEAIDGSFVAKHRFDEVNGELKTSREQLTERDTQITNLKKFEGTAEALQATIKSLEDANAEKAKNYEANLAAERKKNAVKLTLLADEAGKPHDVNMVMGLFDLDQVVLDEATGKITSGFKEQHEKVRAEKAFLFGGKSAAGDGGDGKDKPAGWRPAGEQPADGDKGGAGGKDPSITYGQSLAQIKLGMLGIKKEGAE